ncbi:MAG: hypothetical protein FWC10_10765 [Lentimicrobiaceae bacterium]|nr:hypothetical protein [Lentimicrobiaceae bacterium]
MQETHGTTGFNAIIILDNSVDISYIDKLYNVPPKTTMEIYPSYGEIVYPSHFYSGLLSVKSRSKMKHCYVVDNGTALFYRLKYAYSYFDDERNVLISRNGDEIDASFRPEPFITHEDMFPLHSDKPPETEVQEMFDYLLKNNEHFYIMFSNLHDRVEASDNRVFLEERLNEKTLYKHKSQDAQKILIDLFDCSLNIVHTSLNPANANKPYDDTINTFISSLLFCISK